MTTTNNNITFAELGICEEMLKSIEKIGYEFATPVQAETIPVIRTGSDILAQSQTGTGKTMAFAIPAVERINPEGNNVQVLVLSPTRELAMQCGEEIRKLTPNMPHVKTADIFGGADYNSQFRALKKANLVIGTPGRIMDHMKRKTLNLENLEMIVLDEADEMLNMGFKEDIETILKDAPDDRQIVLFSATIPSGILDIARQFQKDPVEVNIAKNKVTVSQIEQLFVDVPKHQKNQAMNLLMHYYRPQRSIVFTNTKSMVEELAESLCSAGFLAQGIHGDMKQLQRSSVMAGFKKGKTEILVATDVAARGIDVSDIDYVFNYDIPRMTEYYVHRIGRTGRAGRSGTAITICCGRGQVNELRRLATKVKSTIKQADLPTVAGIVKNANLRNIEKISDALTVETTKTSAEMYEALIQKGHTAEQIATALIGIAFPEDTHGLIDLPKAKKHGSDKITQHSMRDGDKEFSNMVVSIGSSNRCAPNHLVGAITEQTGISSKLIGKIIIESEQSFIGVPTELLDEMILAMRGAKILGKPVTATAGGHARKSSIDRERQRNRDRHDRHDKRSSRRSSPSSSSKAPAKFGGKKKKSSY